MAEWTPITNERIKNYFIIVKNMKTVVLLTDVLLSMLNKLELIIFFNSLSIIEVIFTQKSRGEWGGKAFCFGGKTAPLWLTVAPPLLQTKKTFDSEGRKQ